MSKEIKHTPPSTPFEPGFLERLKDPDYTAELLNVAIEEFYEDGDIKSFNKILGYIVKSGNLTRISKETNISRQQIYRIINSESEVSLIKTMKLLKSLGYHLQIKPIEKSA